MSKPWHTVWPSCSTTLDGFGVEEGYVALSGKLLVEDGLGVLVIVPNLGVLI